MKTLSWGKCRVFVKESAATAHTELPTPADGTTALNTTEGDKTEAKIEGGEVEAVRYGHNTYELEMEIRVAAEQARPLADSDGVIAGNYSVIVAPENLAAPGIKIDSSVAKAVTTYTAADGIKVKYTFAALKPTAGDTVKLGTVAIATDNTPTFTEASAAAAGGSAG